MLLTILNNFLLNIVSIFIVLISVCGTGLILNNFFKIGFKLEKLFFFGILIKIILIFFINLFFSLNFFVNFFLILFGFYLFLINLNKIKKNNNFNFLLLIPLIALISIRDGFLFDNFLYHIPLINLAIENNLVLGQSNINFRFGTPTLIYGIYSSFYLPILKYNSVFLLNSVFFIFVLKFFLDQNREKKTLSTYTIIILTLFLFFDALLHPLPLGLFIGRLGTPEYDLLVGLLHIYTIFYIVKNIINKKIKNNFYILILILLTIFIKPTIFPIFLIFIWLLILQKNYIVIMLKTFPIQYCLLIIFFAIFLIKSFLNTGCFYPYFSITCQNVSWYSSENINNLTLASLSWKGYTTNVSSFFDFSWINYWLTSYFLSTIFFIYFLILILINFLLFFVSTKSYQNKYLEYEIWKKILIFHLISIVLWILSSPDLRFIWSTFLIISSILILNILIKLNLIERFFNLLNISKKFYIYLILLLIILCIKSLYFVDYQSLSKKYLVEENYYKKTNKNLLKINIVRDDNFANYKLCGFIPNPCSIDLESLNNLNYEKRFIFNEYNLK